jgi:hypothetical protein
VMRHDDEYDTGPVIGLVLVAILMLVLASA